jgi:hypothetical protein
MSAKGEIRANLRALRGLRMVEVERNWSDRLMAGVCIGLFVLGVVLLVIGLI